VKVKEGGGSEPLCLTASCSPPCSFQPHGARHSKGDTFVAKKPSFPLAPPEARLSCFSVNTGRVRRGVRTACEGEGGGGSEPLCLTASCSPPCSFQPHGARHGLPPARRPLLFGRERERVEGERVSDHSNPGERVRVCVRLRRVRRCVP